MNKPDIFKGRKKQPEKPKDRVAMAILQEAYGQIVPRVSEGGGQIYSKESLVYLGRLYYNAWRVLPVASRCKKQWCMPDYQTILKAYRDITQYHTAIQHSMQESMPDGKDQ